MDALSQAVSLLEASKYFLLFAGSYIEGTAVMLIGGILWHDGIVAFWPAYGALMLGDFLSDMMWYCIGYFGARPFMDRWGHLFNVTPKVVEKVERRFHKHHLWILIVSKLTMGFGLAVGTLMTAGMMRVSVVRYMVINIAGGIVWIYFIMVVGYHFGNVLTLVPVQMKIGIFVLALIGFFVGIRALNDRLAKSDW